MPTYLMEASLLPEGFAYPPAILKLVDLGLTNFENWAFFNSSAASRRMDGLLERYPYTALVPFARRFDNDDIACLTAEKPGRVLIVHDFASAGWEHVREYTSVWQWVIAAIQELAEEDA